jgi:8-oxo-dGTP diphosphatase
VEEETGFAVEIQDLFGVYSGNARDPRFSTVSIVYSAAIAGGRSRDSAEGRVCWLDLRHPPPDLAFDLEDVLQDFLSTLER